MAGQARRASDRLIVEECGSGPTLLCLHGVGGCGDWFRGLGLRLQNRFRILSLDLPGTGRNRVENQPFSIEHCSEVLAEYLLKEAAPLSLLGHSLGTMIGLHLASWVPERLHTLLCSGGMPSVTAATRRRLLERRAIIVEQGMTGLGWQVAAGNFSPRSLLESPEMAALFARLWESQSSVAYLETLDALLTASTESLSGHAKMPCLVLRGSEDGYAPEEESRRFVSSLPGPVRFVELKGCAHMPFLESPATFADAVSDFLDTYAAATPA